MEQLFSQDDEKARSKAEVSQMVAHPKIKIVSKRGFEI